MTHTARRWTIATLGLLAVTLLVLGSQQGALGFNLRGITGFVLVALFWVAIIGGSIWLASNFTGMANVKRLGNSDDAVSILRQRYARGDVNRAEYLQMMQDLEMDKV